MKNIEFRHYSESHVPLIDNKSAEFYFELI